MASMWRASNFYPVTDVQLEAIKLVGARQVLKSGLAIVEPAYGLQVVRSVVEAMRSEDEVATERIARDIGLSGPGRALLFGRKKLVRQDPADGPGLVLVPRIPGLMDDDLSNYAATEDGLVSEVAEVESRALVYKLNSVFTDSTLQDKLGLSARRVQAAKRVATSNPGTAAQSLTDAIQAKGFPRCVVVAGDYAKSVSRAKEFIHQMADTVDYRDTAVPTVTTPELIIMTYNAFGPTDLWSVQGPVKYTTEILCIYQLAIHYGPEYVLFLLGLETAMLNIQIYDVRSKCYYVGKVAGYSSLTGITPVTSDMPANLTSDQVASLHRASAKVLPVRYNDVVVGSAVRVSDRHVLVNSHTLDSVVDVGGGALVDGAVVTASRSVAFDLSVVDRKGGQAQWSLRDPVVDEKVVLVFSVGDTVEYSEVLRVLCVYQDSITLSSSNVVRKGASGAAVIALRDSALLGVFVSKHGHSVVCASFSPSHFTRVTEVESLNGLSERGDNGRGFGDVTFAVMQRRGLESYVEAINNSIAPVYTKVHDEFKLAGLVANYAGCWRTTVDSSRSQLYLQDKRPLLFESVSANDSRCVKPPPILSEVPTVRTVVPGERVCIMTRDGDAVIMSKVVTVVHYTVGAQYFSIDDVGDNVELLDGGLVVSEQDAAVLGQYIARQQDAFGDYNGMCLSLPVTAVSIVDPGWSPEVVRGCTAVLTSADISLFTEQSYYQALGRAALDMFITQAKTTGPGVGSLTLDSVVVDRFLRWIANSLGMPFENVVRDDTVVDRVMWLVGYLFVESRVKCNTAVENMLGVEVGGSVVTPISATSVGVSPVSRVSTPRMFRTYSSDIDSLQRQVDHLKQEMANAVSR